MSAGAWWITHPSFRLHEMGEAHPECPQRLAALEAGLQRSGLDLLLQRLQAPAADIQQLGRVHQADHIEAVLAPQPDQGYLRIDPDTLMNRHSGQAALHAAGAGVAGVDLLLDGRAHFVFCAVRPPGHHAERDRSMGFCLFNSVAVAAAHALARGVERVAIVDFDVHYGNGTAAIFADEPRVLMCNSYQSPLYPYWAGDPQRADRVDVPLLPGTTGAEYRELVQLRWLPALERFAPQLLLVSAGFDAHLLDPMADQRLGDADYEWLGGLLREVSRRHCGDRSLAMLEGGYALDALASAVPAFIQPFVLS